jgi:hypothetical protein
MTSHKDLKRRVRERAARTGESYTTARRHVVAAAGRSGYPFAAGTHRESTLLGHLLQHAGHRDPRTGDPYTEAMLCGLAGGIGFLYAVFEYRGLPPMVTIVAQHHPEPWAPAALRRLGTAHTVAHSSSPRAATAALDAALAAGAAVQCTVGRAALPWHRESGALDADPYPVVVAGRRDDDLLVDDGAGRPHVIGAEPFAQSWAAHRKGRFHRLTLGGPDGEPDLAAAVRDAVATTVAHLTGPVLGNSFDVNMGFSGMARFAAQLRDTGGRTGWARRMAAPGALELALRRVHDCLEREYTAPGATRPLYADFLDEAAVVLSEPRLRAAAALFRASGGLWSAVAGGGDLSAMADRVDEARETEEAAVRILRGVVEDGGTAPTSR